MTQEEIKEITNRSCEIWDKLRELLSREELDLVLEYVELELQLEAKCNK